MRLEVEHDLQAMFDLAQKPVVLLQDLAFLHRQAADAFQLREGLERIAGSNLREVAAVEQLQELDAELDVANPAVPGLHVASVSPFDVRAVLNAAFQGPDAGDVRTAQVAAIDPRLQLLEHEVAPGPGRRRPRGP